MTRFPRHQRHPISRFKEEPIEHQASHKKKESAPSASPFEKGGQKSNIAQLNVTKDETIPRL